MIRVVSITPNWIGVDVQATRGETSPRRGHVSRKPRDHGRGHLPALQSPDAASPIAYWIGRHTTKDGTALNPEYRRLLSLIPTETPQLRRKA